MPLSHRHTSARRSRPTSIVSSYLASHRLQRDTLFGLFSTALRALLVLFTTSILVRGLSEEELGRWSLLILFTTAGYLGIIDLGFHAPVTRRLTLASQNHHLSMHHPLISWYRRVLLKSLLGFAVLATAILVIISVQDRGQSFGALLMTILVINLWLIADTLILPIMALLEAREAIIRLRLVEVALRFATLITTVVAVSIDRSALAVVTGSSLAAAGTLAVSVLLARNSPGSHAQLASNPTPLEVSTPPRTEWFGALLARLANTMNWQVSRTITLLTLGFAAAGQLEILIRFQALGVLLTAGLTGAIFPRLVSASTVESQFGFVLTRTALIVTTALVAFATFVTINGSLILTTWFGSSYQYLTDYLGYIMATQVITAICSTLEIGIVSKARDEVYAVTRWAFLVVNSGVTLLLSLRFGLIGVLVGTLASSVFNLFVLLAVYSRVLQIQVKVHILKPILFGMLGGVVGISAPLVASALGSGSVTIIAVSSVAVLVGATMALHLGGVGVLPAARGARSG